MQLATALWISLSAASGAADGPTEFPYVVQVAGSYADVRSGPGAKYYATQQMKHGDSVEVFRQEPGGWLAIRPPTGSYSLAPASRLEMTDDPTLAKVVGGTTQAWVGTNMASVGDHMWQIELKEGEVVEVLGERVMRIHKQAKPATWILISPPAGEFRWIAAADVTRNASGETPTPDAAPEGYTLADFQISATRPSNRPAETQTPQPSTALDSRRELDEAPAPPASFAGDAKASGVSQSSSDATWTPQGGQPTGAALSNTAAGEAPTITLDQYSGFDEKVRAISVELSSMVTRDPSQWSLGGLRANAEQLLAGAQIRADRERARQLVDRFAAFEQFQSRYLRLTSHATRPDSLEVLDGTVGGAIDPASSEDPDDFEKLNAADLAALVDPRFDGSGWLMPVHSAKRDAPPFALLDEEGVVLQYVTPAPGLNLRRYTKTEVGIIGQKSYLPALATPHLTAHRVINLARHRR